MIIKFSSIVDQVEERFRSRYISGVGNTATFNKVSLGWFIHLRGSYEALYIGNERPELLQGDKVTISIIKD